MDISFLPGVQFDYTTNRFFDLVDVVINPFIGVFARVEANHVTPEFEKSGRCLKTQN